MSHFLKHLLNLISCSPFPDLVATMKKTELRLISQSPLSRIFHGISYENRQAGSAMWNAVSFIAILDFEQNKRSRIEHLATLTFSWAILTPSNVHLRLILLGIQAPLADDGVTRMVNLWKMYYLSSLCQLWPAHSQIFVSFPESFRHAAFLRSLTDSWH